MQLKEIPTPGYERVVHAADADSGLNAVISIHSTVLGPSLGGIRMLPYASLDEAVVDVNRLAKGMTYKHAIAETGQGGGKAVIIGDPARDKSEGLFRAMGRFIETFGGAYIAAEDMNITVSDLETLAMETRWVSGLSVDRGSSGNPSPMTALGCELAIRACLQEVYDDVALSGRVLAIHGVGAVGSILAGRCASAAGRIYVSDVDREKARSVAARHGAEWIEDPETLLRIPCDVLAPCARGGVLNAASIPSLRCRIVAGAANNQLAEDGDARRLADRGILYAPDYVVNAGGVINIACEFAAEEYSAETAAARCQSIPRALKSIFQIAQREGITTAQAADRLAEARMAAGRV